MIVGFVGGGGSGGRRNLPRLLIMLPCFFLSSFALSSSFRFDFFFSYSFSSSLFFTSQRVSESVTTGWLHPAAFGEEEEEEEGGGRGRGGN